MADDIVYVFTNEAMPDYVKLGRTNDVERRLKELYTTPVPLPFECFYAARVANAVFVEKQLHDAFGDHRVGKSREFFRINPARIASAIKIAAIEEVTPKKLFEINSQDEQAVKEAKERRSNFNFEMVKIPIGSILIFKDEPSITCKVIDRRKVEFEGEITSISAAAQKVLLRQGYEWSVAGPLYWMFEGETLEERRKKMEESDN